MTSQDLLLLLAQIALILALARVCGSLLTRLGQPAVIGEILAGILLGPTLLGWLAPGVMQAVFPQALRPPLELLSQLGTKLNEGLKLPAVPSGVREGASVGAKGPNQLKSMMLLSRALEQQDRKNPTQAIALYKESLVANPDNARAKTLLASLERGTK